MKESAEHTYKLIERHGQRIRWRWHFRCGTNLPLRPIENMLKIRKWLKIEDTFLLNTNRKPWWLVACKYHVTDDVGFFFIHWNMRLQSKVKQNPFTNRIETATPLLGVGPIGRNRHSAIIGSWKHEACNSQTARNRRHIYSYWECNHSIANEPVDRLPRENCKDTF